MSPQTLTILAGSVSAFVSALIAVFAARRLKETKAALPLACLMVLNFVYAGAYTLEINSPSLAVALSWLKVEYLGVTFVPVFWFIFARAFVRGSKPMGRLQFALLVLVPLATVILMWTNEGHGLIARSFHLRSGTSLSVLEAEKGPWYWVSTVYLYILMLYGTITVMAQASRVSGKFRGQLGVLTAASILPWLGHGLLLLGASPRGLDLGPFLLALSGGLFAWGVFKFSLFDLVPIARDMVVEAMSDGVLVLDRRGRLVDINRAARSLLPLLATAQMGADVPSLLGQGGVELPRAGGFLEFSLGLDGGARSYRASCLEIPGETEPRGMVVILTDTTREREILARLELLVSTDELTKVDNRRRFFEHARRELELAQRRERPLTFAMLDLDNFKTVNDSHGHAAGDAALVAVCAACREILRSTDILCRFGGEEFMIILPEAGPTVAFEIIERARRRIAETLILAGPEAFRVTASFGVAGSEGIPRETLETYLRQADEAMYRAKSAGRNRTEVYKA